MSENRAKSILEKIQKGYLKWGLQNGDLVLKLKMQKDERFNYKTIRRLLPSRLGTIESIDNKWNDLTTVKNAVEKIRQFFNLFNYEIKFNDEALLDPYLDEKGRLVIVELPLKQAEDQESKKVDTKEHYIYYIKANGDFHHEKIIIDIPGKKAVLEKNKGYNSSLTQGQIVEVNSEISLMELTNADGKYNWYISMANSDSGKKDVFICEYLKISEDVSKPTLGEAIIAKCSAVDGTNFIYFAEYYLYRKRHWLKIEETKLEVSKIVGDMPEDYPVFVKNWRSIQIFTGQWKCYIINPIDQRLDLGYLIINKNGLFNLQLPDKIANPYTGKVKIMATTLIMSYDYIGDIANYKANIYINTKNYQGELFNAKDESSTIYGVICGLDRHNTGFYATRIALRKIDLETLNGDAGTKPFNSKSLKDPEIDEYIKNHNLEKFMAEKEHLNYFGQLGIMQ